MTWQSEILRFTGFIPGVATQPSQKFWKDLVGEDPESQTQKPRQSLISETGPWGPGSLTIETQPLRIDCVLRPTFPKGNEPPPDILGQYDEVVVEYDEIVHRLLELDQCPPLTRLAYGAVLRFPVESFVDAMKFLDNLLPAVDIAPESSSDLMYRINRKRIIIFGEKKILFNRLNTWQTIKSGFISIDLLEKGPAHREDLSIAVRLELDINTAPSEDLFKTEELVPIYRTLRELGDEIAEKGDIYK